MKMKNINRLLILAGSMFLLLKPFEGISQYVYSDANLQKQLDKARNDVYNEKFDEAVAKYAILVKNNDNKTVSAEYAYVLALSGCYEGAVMNIDKVFASGQVDKDVLFYTSQVLRLMEYDPIANLFWTFSYDKKLFAPSWISGQYRSFVEKYHYPASINTDGFGTALQRANKLAEHRQYFQSIVLFLELIDSYPDEYLPYIGLSALWENIGYRREAEKYLRKGIEKMGKDKFKIDPFGAYEKHLEKLKANNTNVPMALQQHQNNDVASNAMRSKRFTYYGISYINKAWAVNWKYGHYSSENTFFTIGLGYYNYEKTNTFSVDISFMGKAWGFFLGGLSLSGRLSGGEFGLGVGPSVGFAIPLPDGKSSIDILGNMNMYFQKANMSVGLSASIGYTRYF